MAVANMLESQLQGARERGEQDRLVAPGPAGGVRAPVQPGPGPRDGLAEVAIELGWAPGGVVVVDADLGISGRFGEARGGFREVVSRVCLGEVGAIFGLEVSRLGRSSAELTRLMELARLTDTLLIDADGVYDLSNATTGCCWV
jgi:hypothetical protein